MHSFSWWCRAYEMESNLTWNRIRIQRNINNSAAKLKFQLFIDTGGMWCELLAPISRVNTFYPSPLEYVPLFGPFESNGDWYIQRSLTLSIVYAHCSLVALEKTSLLKIIIVCIRAQYNFYCIGVLMNLA